MKFDCNIHIGNKPNIEEDKKFILNNNLLSHEYNLLQTDGFSFGNIMMMNPDSIIEIDAKCLKKFNKIFTYTLTINPDNLNSIENIKKAIGMGIYNFKFHPYFFSITKEKYKNVAKISKFISENKCIISVCCSYGSKLFYKVKPMEVLNVVLENTNSKVVALHMGGAKPLDLLVLSMEYDNLYTETSFSIPFWLGSNVEKDYIFLVKKIGPEKILFGSDKPYVNRLESVSKVKNFLSKKCKFNFESIDKIFQQKVFL